MEDFKSSCIIAGAAPFDGRLIPSPPPGALLIAADGGSGLFRRSGLHADLSIGDFDSSLPPNDMGEVLRYQKEKDDTDMQLAVRYALEYGCRTIDIYGGLGGSFAHTLSNIQTLALISQSGAEGWLHGSGCDITALTCGRFSVSGAPMKISVFAYGGDAHGVFERGMKYSLNDAVLTCDNPIGASNELLNGCAEIEVRSGTLLIVLEESGGRTSPKYS